MLLTLAADLVRVAGGRRPGAPPHRRGARDVAAPAARSWSSRCAPAATWATCEPTRIDVQSEDEIGELAQAFNDVEAVTIEVAQEQSRLLRKGMGDLFVNLARRNQSLLERQLELLDELERNEHDPAALDALFKLDHMATRMRRNAESLLVLSGAEQPRQWQQPIALARRRARRGGRDRRLPARRARRHRRRRSRCPAARSSDVAHLLAELLENATSFSPPDSAVVVSGAVDRRPGFVLAISDQGIGMPPERIAEANELLAKPPVVGLALSRGPRSARRRARSPPATASPSSSAPARRVGLVALVAPADRGARAPGRARRPPPPASGPVYAPDADDRRRAAPSAPARVAWRPPDEPPVEQWRREGLADAAPASRPAPTRSPCAPVAPPVAAPSRPAGAHRRPMPRPSEPPIVASEPPPVHDADRVYERRRRRRATGVDVPAGARAVPPRPTPAPAPPTTAPTPPCRPGSRAST